MRTQFFISAAMVLATTLILSEVALTYLGDGPEFERPGLLMGWSAGGTEMAEIGTKIGIVRAENYARAGIVHAELLRAWRFANGPGETFQAGTGLLDQPF